LVAARFEAFVRSSSICCSTVLLTVKVSIADFIVHDFFIFLL
jgi:hypothetical protein